ncbi:hypothetical protein LFLT20_01820 [Limosilactobacillus fermentum]|nr:hypothetical protein LFLT20_01820 [Limosilactobacillus fermentum]
MADQELFMQNMLTELTTSQRFTEGNAPAFSPTGLITTRLRL